MGKIDNGDDYIESIGIYPNNHSIKLIVFVRLLRLKKRKLNKDKLFGDGISMPVWSNVLYTSQSGPWKPT
jgi:hypothetical protein